MAVAVKMPKLGETVVEGTVARWLKATGDSISRLEPLLEISTDKIDTEVPAPAAGTLLEILVDEGKTVRAGEIIAYIGEPGESTGATTATSSPDVAASNALGDSAEQENGAGNSTENGAGRAQGQPTTAGRPQQKPTGREFISPVVANIAREHAVNLDEIQGTGLGGRITKKDILAHLARPPQPGRTDEHPAAEPTGDWMPAGIGDDLMPSGMGEHEVWEPLSTMRRLIADHMVASKRASPHVTSIFEVDMTEVVRHREAHKAAFAQKGVRLTFTPYFVAAAAHALRRVPQVNARFHDQDGQRGIIYAQRIHIGIAVAINVAMHVVNDNAVDGVRSSETGLVVPVIRDADERNLAGLARAVGDLAKAAQARRLAPDATQGGTFTLTNHGTGGSLLGTPIINQPQAAILGVGAITKRPVVRSASTSLLPSADDAIVIRPMCYLSLTFDHRLIDGATADAFLTAVQQLLEHWQDEN